MINSNFLEFLDITENEERVYKGFLGHPDTNSSKLSRILGMDKSSVYRAVDGLLQRDLIVKQTNEDEVVYRAVNPNKLKDLHKAKLLNLESRKDDLDYFITDLLGYSKNHQRISGLTVEYGMEAHMKAMELSLEVSSGHIKEKWMMGNPIFKLAEYQKYISSYIPRRVEKGIRDYYLVDSSYNNNGKSDMQSSKALLKEVRRNPSDADDRNSFRIFGEYVELVSFDEKNDFIVVIINDRFLSGMFSKFFEFIWGRSESI